MRTLTVAVLLIVASTPAFAFDAWDAAEEAFRETDRKRDMETRERMLEEMKYQSYTQEMMLNEQRYQSELKEIELNTLSSRRY